MADVLRAKLIGTEELQRQLDHLNPEMKRRITTPALLESMQTTLRDAARNKILPGGQGPPRPDILTSRTGTLRRSLTGNFSIDVNERLRWVEGGTHLIYGAFHEKTRRAFLAPALKDTQSQYEAIFRKWWDRASEFAS